MDERSYSRPPQRKLLRRWEIPGDVRFLTFSCFNNLPLFSNDAIKDAFAAHLDCAVRRHDVQLVAWVVMLDHVHLLLLREHGPTLRVLLQNLKRIFALEVLNRWRELNAPVLGRIIGRDGKPHFWRPGGGYDRNMRNGREVEQKIDYIHENPVESGLVELAHEWRWSSARFYQGMVYAGPPVARVECG